MTHITSRKNSEVQLCRKLLEDSAFRKKEEKFICQGEVMLQEALKSGMCVERIFCLPELASKMPEGILTFTVTEEIIEVISGVKSASGIVFVCRMPQERTFKGRRFIALEDLRDPGNVGTIIRTADALGLDGVIFLGNCADCFAPKTVRSTMGSLFRMPLYFMDADELKENCQKQGIQIVAACLSNDSKELKKGELSDNCCILIGNEAHGLSDRAIAISHSRYIIPMHSAESLNAAVAASIFMWEMTGESR